MKTFDLSIKDISSSISQNRQLPNVEDAISNNEKAEDSKNEMDKMGQIFNKTRGGKACYWSELSYFETNDL